MGTISAETLRKYCTGCGLCPHLLPEEGAKMELDGRGFLVPAFRSSAIQGEKSDLLLKCCPGLNEELPGGGKHSSAVSGESLWMFTGYAADADLRYRASSGGALSAYLCSLLKSGAVSFVAHVHGDAEIPLKNVMKISRTPQEVASGCGSRYSPAAPLSALDDLCNQEGTGAVVGRPCDIRALRKYLAAGADGRLAGKITHFVSFLCAGMPSEGASVKLIRSLGCDPADVTGLRYRGCGWPGNFRVELKNGEHRECSYEKAWGETLGRNVVPRCKYCFDGIGEAADVVFGDGWYCSETGYPDFADKPGINIIIARTQTGLDAMKECIARGEIIVEAQTLADSSFSAMQPTHTLKRRYSLYRLAALRLSGSRYPVYNAGRLFALSKKGSVYKGLRQFAGTLQRMRKDGDGN